MKKTIIFLSLLFLVVFSAKAQGEYNKYLNVSAGFQWKKTVNALISYELEKNHNSWEFYLDLSTTWKTDPICGKVCYKYFFDYKTIGIGIARNLVISRGKNSMFRFRIGADVGANDSDKLQVSIDAGFEYSYTFKNRCKLFILQKNDFVFWSDNNFRNGLLIGIKMPLNK